MKTLSLGFFLASICLNGLTRGEDPDEERSPSPPGGFYFPVWEFQSGEDYVGVFPVSRLSGYSLYRPGQPAQLVGEISGSPFVLHSGPRGCGWVGLPGFPWLGYGLCGNPHPGSAALVTTSDQSASIHLTEGMSREQILKAVGPPSKKILLRQKEIWEYRGYSLLFDSDGLKEIR